VTLLALLLRFDALTIPRPGMVNEMEWSEVDWDAERWTIPAAKMKTGWDHVVPLSRQALANPEQRSEADRPSPVRVFLLEDGAAIKQHAQHSACGCLALTPRLIIVPTDSGPPSRPCLTTKDDSRTQGMDGDVVELQLAHLDNSTVEGLYKSTDRRLIGSRTKLMQHWADSDRTTGSIPRR